MKNGSERPDSPSTLNTVKPGAAKAFVESIRRMDALGRAGLEGFPTYPKRHLKTLLRMPKKRGPNPSDEDIAKAAFLTLSMQGCDPDLAALLSELVRRYDSFVEHTRGQDCGSGPRSGPGPKGPNSSNSARDWLEGVCNEMLAEQAGPSE